VTHQLILSMVLIVVMMASLDWFESARTRMARAHRRRREQLDTRAVINLPKHIPQGRHAPIMARPRFHSQNLDVTTLTSAQNLRRD